MLTRFLPLLLAAAPLPAQYAAANPEWNRPVAPFRIAGNLYYVGAEGISSFLLTSSQGHILFDTGFEETAAQVEANMARLGFRFADIKLILATHGHNDHSGGISAVKRKTGARFLVNPAERTTFLEGDVNDFAWPGRFAYRPVTPDGLLRDGEPVRVGPLAVTPHFTPGHTKGGTSYAFTVEDSGRPLRVIVACSVSTPGYKLVNNAQYPDIVQDVESTIAKMRAFPLDIFLSGHGWDFGLVEKAKARAADASASLFLNAAEYRAWLEKSLAAFRAELAKQRAARP